MNSPKEEQKNFETGDACESGDFSDGEDDSENVASHVTSTPFEPGKSANCHRDNPYMTSASCLDFLNP